MGLAFAASGANAQAGAAPAAEESTTLTLDLPQSDWGYVRNGWGLGGTSIFDATTGKMRGMVETSKDSDLQIDPAGKFYYVSETIWSKGDRGTRQDMVSIYDATQLKLQAEVPIPGRMIVGGRKHNFIVSDDGKMGYIYNFDPASSVNIVDLAKRKFVKTVELPGCADLIPNPGVGFSALCSDGSIATVALSGAKPEITRTAPFFSATADPIFDNFVYSRTAREATMLTYTGLIYTAKLGAAPTVSAPWSLQQAAGVPVGDTKPLAVNWMPGGNQPMALNRKTGMLYVLMHMGEYWSHKEPGTEIWIVDLAAKKVTKRLPLKTEAGSVEVTQSQKPVIFINDEENTVRIIDPESGEEKYVIKRGGGGVIYTFQGS